MPDRSALPSLPSDPRLRLLLVVAGLLVVALGIVGGRRMMAARAEVRELQALRDSLESLRVAFDECRYDLGREEVAFRDFDRRVDSLREEVRRYESRDTRGVAAEEYDAYLETFDRYNLSVAEWDVRADSLRARSATCRERARRHNAFAESLQVRLEARQRND